MSQIASKQSPRPAIERLLRPRSIAIVGASTTPRALGNTLLQVLQGANYSGELYLVNPNYTEIQGRPCVPSIDALPVGIDCAALAIPRASVLETVRACIRRQVGSAIIFCAGFAEAGAEGRAEGERSREKDAKGRPRVRPPAGEAGAEGDLGDRERRE